MDCSQVTALLTSSGSLHWRQWDGEYVVFDEASGQTHQLDALTACALLCIEDGASDPAALVTRVAEHASVSSGAVVRALPSILEELAKADLIDTMQG